MAKCPSCGKNVSVFKEWNYGPKSRKGAQMRVKLYHCKCGDSFREYVSKNTGKITIGRKPKKKSRTNSSK
jgi:hypothetical protein